MSAKRKRGAGIIGFGIAAGIVLYLALGMYPGPFRYRNLPEAERCGNEVRIGAKTYIFYGALEDGMQRGELVAYVKEADGYVTEFYSVNGDDSGWIIAQRRVMCGDTYVMREEP